MDLARASTSHAQGMTPERRAELWRIFQTYDLAGRTIAWDNYERWRAIPREHRQSIRGPKPPVCISCGSFPTSRYNDYSPRFACGPHPVVIAR